MERTDTGRVCDPTCSNPTSDSYGTRGCGTGSFGYDCRFCYINEDMALEVDRPGYHVIMCDTLMPPVAYTRRSLVGRDSNPLSFHPAGKDELDAAGMDKPDAAVNPRHKDQGWKDAFLANGDEPKWKRTMKSGRKRTLQSMDSSMCVRCGDCFMCRDTVPREPEVPVQERATSMWYRAVSTAVEATRRGLSLFRYTCDWCAATRILFFITVGPVLIVEPKMETDVRDHSLTPRCFHQ